MQDDVALLNDLNWGYRSARVLHIANDVGLFTLLSEKPLSSEQICKNIDLNPEMTEKLLIACTSLGLVKKEKDEYKNTALAQVYLVKGRELYQGNIISHAASMWDFWGSLIGHDTGQQERLSLNIEDPRNFILAMQNVAVTGRVELFMDSVDLTGRKKLLDVGGGPGTYSIAACKKYPYLKAVVFDLPETVCITEEFIAKEKISDRVSVQAGNWDSDTFGHDYDVVLFSNVLHGHGSNAKMKLSKAYESLIDDGLLVIQDFLLNDDKTGPLVPALFNIMVGTYSKKEIIALIEENRFVRSKLVAECERIGSTWITAEKM